MILSAKIIAEFKKHCSIPDRMLEPLAIAAEGNALQFGQLMVQQGWIDRECAGMIIGNELNITYLNLEKTLFQPEAVELLGKTFAERYQAIPVYRFGETITLAMTDPTDKIKIDAISRLIDKPIEAVLSFPAEIATAIQVNYQSADKLDQLALSIPLPRLSSLHEAKMVELPELVEVCNSIILLALKERASDIHIEPKRHECRIRFRIDGMLLDRLYIPQHLNRALVSRIKVMASMDIAERRKPQDGRINFETPIKTIDIRVSSLPTLHGEKVVMRILGSLVEAVPLNLDKLDFAPDILAVLKSTLDAPNGILFVTGPTGSGKTTTLYGALNYLNSPTINISTIEDPIEYEIATLNQIQVDERADRNFSNVLRSLLRQDPNVILVGETRDTETAKIATKAALTGHRVLSSLHTNNALQAVMRLIEMGVEPYVVAPSIIGVIGQRLVRRVCEYCKIAYDASEDELTKHFHFTPGTPLPKLTKGLGCHRCSNTGYFGRIAIHELLRINTKLRDYILDQRSYSEMRIAAYETGFRDMRYDGFVKALKGLTTIDEVVRVTMGD